MPIHALTSDRPMLYEQALRRDESLKLCPATDTNYSIELTSLWTLAKLVHGLKCIYKNGNISIMNTFYHKINSFVQKVSELS